MFALVRDKKGSYVRKSSYVERVRNKAINVAIDKVFNQTFGQNYGGHPRNTVSFMRSVQDAQQLDALQKLCPQLESSSLPGDFTDSDAFASCASRYGQSFSDFQEQIDKLIDIRLSKSVKEKKESDVVKGDDTIKFDETDKV